MNGIFTRKTINFILLISLVATSFTACGQHPNNATVTNYTGSAIQQTKEEEAKEETVEASTQAKELYIVENLDMTDETIALYSLNEGKQLRYKYNMTTKFMDKFGGNSQWASFTVGTVVTIGELLPASGALSSVQKSDDVWMYQDISKYKLDSEKSLISIDGSNYKITATTKIYSDTEKILLSDIGADDIITVVGQDKEVISISVTTGHGYFILTNTALFDNSLIFIGNKIVTKVYGNEQIEVPEGTYKITVANNGWGGSGEYTVQRNQTTEINLEDLKGEGPSYCLLTFLVTVPDTYVYLDGKLVDTEAPGYVQYGSHKLVVKCDGYNTWNKTLVVNSETATITLAMESESDNSSSTTTNNSDSTTTSNTSNSTSENEEHTAGSSNSNDSDKTNKSSKKKDDYDYEVDYLSTISDLISNLAN